MEVPRLGGIRAVAAGLYHSSQQSQILNPLSKARDRTLISRFLVGFASAVPQQELLECQIFNPLSEARDTSWALFC